MTTKKTRLLMAVIKGALNNGYKYADVIVDDLLACIYEADTDNINELAEYIDSLFTNGKELRVTHYNTEAIDSNDDRHYVVKFDTVLN